METDSKGRHLSAVRDEMKEALLRLESGKQDDLINAIKVVLEDRIRECDEVLSSY